MVKRKITETTGNRMIMSIPAYLRDKFGLKKGTVVDVTDNGNSIVITPLKEH
jgi:AbrB family looped-hinge helix DNA binding protein